MTMKKVYPKEKSMPSNRTHRNSNVDSDFSDLKHHLRETRLNRVMGL